MNQETDVVIIGGGATGVGILRDLSMRGLRAVLFEQGGLANGTSSRFHGLLHSGARYAVKDKDAARECIDENMILRSVAKACVEETEGFFVLTKHDDPAFVEPWVQACTAARISVQEVSLQEALALEPNLAQDVYRVFRVPDSCVDGFRLVWHNALAARQCGGVMHTYHLVTNIQTHNGKVTGVEVQNTLTGEQFFIACRYVVNAAGPWAGKVAHMAGLDVAVTPDRGTLIVFNHLFTSRVINRLHPSADGDIFVPHGSVTIFGTTSATAQSPDDTRPTSEEVLRLLSLGEPLFPKVRQYRILRAFAGNRPLYTPPHAAAGRGASRNFIIVDHETEGLQGFSSIFGGKLTTYRLMAEKMCDLVCARLDNASVCRTATEPLTQEPDKALLNRGRAIFPAQGVQLVADRTGAAFPQVMARLERGEGKEIICECEMVTRAEVETVATDPATSFLNDIRFRTRMGMGTCQGNFCSIRAIGALTADKIPFAVSPKKNLRTFLKERWRGIRPALWGTQLQEIELGRAIFMGSLNLNGAGPAPLATTARPEATPPGAMNQGLAEGLGNE